MSFRESRTDYSPGSRRRRSDAEIEKAAAEWLALREGRRLTAVEQAAFAQWLEADPRHWEALAILEANWRAFDRLAQYPRPEGAAANPDFFARPVWLRRRLLVPLAAAAAVAVLTIMGARLWRAPGKPAVELTRANPATVFRHLADGSGVKLKAGSEVLERFTTAERRVQLVRGEAHFTVAKNPRRPFIVEAGGAAVRAVGTAFDVRLDAAAVEVLVTEGRVQVAAPKPATAVVSGADAVLVAGQRAVIATTSPRSGKAAPPRVETLAADEIDRVLAWQSSRLDFDATPLAEAVEQCNHHPDSPPGTPRLRIDDPALGRLHISGRIRADDLAGFVELLQTGFGVEARRLPDGDIVLKSRQ